MKKLIFTLIGLIGLGLSVQAAIYTVSNHPNGGAQFTNLQAAYDSASVGDTLYLEGTNIPYQMVFIQYFEKQLTVVGIGFNPNVIPSKKTIIGATPGLGTFGFRGGASGSAFYGVTFASTVLMAQSIGTLVFENCRFNVELSWSNNSGQIVARNCIFGAQNGRNLNLPSSLAATLVLSNCVVAGYIEGNSNNVNTVSIDHCLFLRTQNVTGVLNRVNNGSINNSIIMNTTTIASSSSGNSFINNIAATAATLPPAGNVGSGNMVNTDPLLVNYSLNQGYSSAHDYDVQAGSPAIGAASDGTDIGVHGGSTNFSETGEVLWAPIVRSVIINNTSVAPNGTINVQVEASRPATD